MENMKETHVKNHRTGALESVSVQATRWVGTTASLVVHTILFIAAFAIPYFGILSMDEVLLILTTIVSLEAIYLAIFIQMTVNRNNQSLAEVEKDIDEIQEDVDEIGEDIDELSEDVEEISEDIDEIQEDIDEIQEDEEEDDKHDEHVSAALGKIETNLQQIIREIETIKSKK